MNIVVAGGGTAGWLTALYVKHICPNDDITLIESEDIGILGAGEGATIVFLWLLNTIGITENDLINEANATFKTGISFENWRGDGNKYFHSFGLFDSNLNPQNFAPKKNPLQSGLSGNGEMYPFINTIANGDNIDDMHIAHRLAYLNKSPFVYENGETKLVSNYSLHFDASLLAKFLRKVGEGRGIKRVEGVITGIKNNIDGCIKSIKLESDIVLNTDFVFDCTGFARLIIGKHYGAKWKSYQDKLKVNTAIPFFLPIDDEIPPYTGAIAMKYGWMWKIPLQNRYGCGYVFDNHYINVEQAKAEVEEMVGQEIKINKIIPFDAGRYETPWIKNCISVGLSSMFTEPIEATSLWLAANQLVMISSAKLKNQNQNEIDDYNDMFVKTADTTTDFLQFHYNTDRNDTDFWRDYKSTTTLTPTMEKRLKRWEYRTPNKNDIDKLETQFEETSWFIVANGNGVIPKFVIDSENNENDLDNKLANWSMEYDADGSYVESIAYSHNDMLELIKCKKITIT